MSARKSKTRPKTGSWRPFRPAGMSDGAWKTILLLHRYPTDEMDEEERKHCLGPMLFGKGGPRFGDYGRGWIQERADELVRDGLTPYAIDAREWRDEIADAIDYYNGMGFDEAEAKGVVSLDADFFTCNMSFPREWSLDRSFTAKDAARAKMDEIWYGICYGPFGAGPWEVMTKGVMNGWKNVFTCDADEAFQGIGNFDWRCASLGMDVDDVLEMSEMCPVSGNATIIGGIDLALDFAEKGGLSTNQRSRVIRFLKRAIGELYKRGKAMMKTMGKRSSLSSFFGQIKDREATAQRFFGWAMMPGAEAYGARAATVLEARLREPIRDDNLPKETLDWGLYSIEEEYDKAQEKIIALAVKWKQSAERERYAKEEAKEKDREKLKAERKKSKKKGNGGNK